MSGEAVIRIRLTASQAEELAAEFRSAKDRKRRDRLPIILMAHDGRPHQDIAADLGIHRRCAQRRLDAYLERGLSGLTPRSAKGKTPGIPATPSDEIERGVIEGPAKQGLDRANWTHEELADHLKKTRGIKTSRSAMHRFCRKVGIRPYRPTYRYLRGDPAKQAQAREDLAGLKKGRPQASSSC